MQPKMPDKHVLAYPRLTAQWVAFGLRNPLEPKRLVNSWQRCRLGGFAVSEANLLGPNLWGFQH